MTCKHRHVQRTDREIYLTTYAVGPGGDMDVMVGEPEYLEDDDEAPWYTCMDCLEETQHYNELTGEWDA